MPKIEIIVDRDGTTRVEGYEFQNGSCQQAINELLAGLQIMSDEQKDDEVHQIVTT
jgi:hypothetical protein